MTQYDSVRPRNRPRPSPTRHRTPLKPGPISGLHPGYVRHQQAPPQLANYHIPNRVSPPPQLANMNAPGILAALAKRQRRPQAPPVAPVAPPTGVLPPPAAPAPPLPPPTPANYGNVAAPVDPRYSQEGLAAVNPAVAYAQKRLAQFQQVSNLLPSSFAGYQGFQLQPGDDPAAAYRNASGVFAGLAGQAGFADPRQYLAQLLMRARQ